MAPADGSGSGGCRPCALAASLAFSVISATIETSKDWQLSIRAPPCPGAPVMPAKGQSFAFVARPISGGSERRYRPFGENDSAAHGRRLRARFLVFHTDRWDVSQCDHTENTRLVTLGVSHDQTTPSEG